jgi:hypothetical protein
LRILEDGDECLYFCYSEGEDWNDGIFHGQLTEKNQSRPHTFSWQHVD